MSSTCQEWVKMIESGLWLCFNLMISCTFMSTNLRSSSKLTHLYSSKILNIYKGWSTCRPINDLLCIGAGTTSLGVILLSIKRQWPDVGISRYVRVPTKVPVPEEKRGLSNCGLSNITEGSDIYACHPDADLGHFKICWDTPHCV